MTSKTLRQSSVFSKRILLVYNSKMSLFKISVLPQQKNTLNTMNNILHKKKNNITKHDERKR